nr:tripartite tricarboxylate transporter substrate-binding protein [Micromonospora pallida]
MDVLVGSVNSVLSQHKAGDVRILGTATAQPSTLIPQVPTLAAQGYEVVSPGTLNISAPAGVPADVVAVLEKALKEASSSPAFVDKLPASGYELSYRTSKELEQYWAETEERVRPVVTAAK